MKTAAMIFALALVGSQALAQEQTRIYGPDGRSLGTAAPYGTGSVRYRDSRGRTAFTTTTMNGVTRFYDSGGHLTARRAISILRPGSCKGTGDVDRPARLHGDG